MARSADPCVLTSSIVVERSIQQCWDLYTDNAQVSQWAPAVSNIECDTAKLDTAVIRKSCVTVDGRTGHTVEQCTVLEPLKRIEFTVVEETFGFSHMLNSYGFSMTFDVNGDVNETLMVMETRYVPKKIFASVMNSKATQQPLVNLMSATLSGFKLYIESQIKTSATPEFY